MESIIVLKLDDIYTNCSVCGDDTALKWSLSAKKPICFECSKLKGDCK